MKTRCVHSMEKSAILNRSKVKLIDIRTDETLPCIVDFEASSLNRDSYPIQVAWSTEDGFIESYLINVSLVRGWTDWDEISEDVHGISREELVRKGKDPRWVCQRMNAALPGKVLHTDAIEADSHWLKALFDFDGGSMSPAFSLQKFESLFSGVISPEDLEDTQVMVQDILQGKHKADLDVRNMQAVWGIEKGILTESDLLSNNIIL